MSVPMTSNNRQSGLTECLFLLDHNTSFSLLLLALPLPREAALRELAERNP